MKSRQWACGVLCFFSSIQPFDASAVFAAQVCKDVLVPNPEKPGGIVVKVCTEVPTPSTRPSTATTRPSSAGDETVNASPPVTTVADPRVTPVFPATTQTNCTLPDGRPGVQVVIAPVLGTAFEIQCVDPGVPAPAGAVVRPIITVEMAAEATDFPRISAHMTPGPHGGLPGVRYAVHLEGVTTPTIAPSVQGVALRGRGTAIGFTVSTDTGSTQGTHDPDGRFSSNTPGSPDREAGSLVWQTGGMKSIRVVTRWRLEYEVSYNDGVWTSIGTYEVNVVDNTPYPITGLTTQITSTE
jgi:hypothetical protein